MTKQRTNRETEAARLEAEAKAIRRAEKAFWQEVEERIDEVKSRFMSDKFDDICRTYGAWTEDDREALYNHLVSDQQVRYYTQRHQS